MAVQTELFPLETAASAAADFHSGTDLCEELRGFTEFGSPTRESSRAIGGREIPVFENEFWTARQRQCHSLHEVSYRACFKPQLPAFFIRRCCPPDGLVYDPFMGRGTTLIEARLLGRRVCGNDANPICHALAGPRLSPPDLDVVKSRLAEVRFDPQPPSDPELLVFYAPQTLAELDGWRAWFQSRQAGGSFDRVDAWLQMVGCNRLTGHSKGFFSVYTLPPNQATSVRAQRKINAKRNQQPEYRDTKALMLRKSRQLLRDPLPAGFHASAPLLLCGSADQTPQIADASVDLVVTSPPFLDTVDYETDNWLRMWFCGARIEKGSIWQLRSIEDWVERMQSTFAELRRVLKPGGVVAFEVGEVRKATIDLENEVLRAGLAAGLDPQCVVINSQNFTKTANCWGVSNNTKGTNSNRISVFRRPG